MNFNEPVTVVFNGDATPLQKETRKVEKTMHNSGKAMAQSNEKWLRAAEGAFRKYAGRVGGMIGDLIQQYDKFGKAVAGSSIGAKLASAMNRGGLERKQRQLNDPELVKRLVRRRLSKGENIADISNSIEGARSGVGKGLALNSAMRVGGGVLGGLAAGATGASMLMKSAASDFTESKALRQTVYEFERIKRAVELIRDPLKQAAYLTKQLGDNAAEKYKEMQSAAKMANYELENTKAWVTYGENADRFINNYGKRIGMAIKQGVGTFLNRISGVSADDENLATEMQKAKAQTEALKERAKVVEAKIADDKKTAAEIAKLDAENNPEIMEDYLKNQVALLDLKRKQTGELADQLEYNKAVYDLTKWRREEEEKIQKTQDEVNKAADEATAAKHKELGGQIGDIAGKVREQNPGMYDGKSDFDTAVGEAEMLRKSTMTPSELLLERKAELGTKGTKALLTRANAIGGQGSFKRQIESANKFTKNQETRETQAALQKLLRDYSATGAVNVMPKNGK